jgi:predicted dehydrogenase
MVKYDRTGADEDTTMVITFPTTTPSNLPNRSSHAVAMTAFRVATDPDQKNTARPAIRIQGTKGEIQVDGPAYRPPRYRIIPMKKTSGDAGVTEVENPVPSDGHGMYWEADEAARCVRDGKLESDGLPWEESIIIMETMDEIRKQNGLVYPEKIESTAYPVKL